MSSAPTEEVHTAVPIPDLSFLDGVIGDLAALKEAVHRIRPADLGRELSRRSLDEGRRLVEAYDDRRAAAMLRSAHPAVAANVIAACDPAPAARRLGYMPIEHQVAILS